MTAGNDAIPSAQPLGDAELDMASGGHAFSLQNATVSSLQTESLNPTAGVTIPGLGRYDDVTLKRG